MSRVSFQGFHGVEIDADTFGEPENPPVLLLPATGQTKEMWHGAGRALGEAGRYAVCVDLRGHGCSGWANDGRYDLDAYAGDVRAVLGQLSSRAVVVAVGASGLAAIVAVGESPTPLVSALVLVGVTTRVEPQMVSRISATVKGRAAAFETLQAAMDAVAAIHPFEPPPTAVDKLGLAFELCEDGVYRWRGDPRALGTIDVPAVSPRVDKACAGITTPISLIRGAANESVSAEAAEHLRSLAGDAEVSEIDGVGHYVVTDREDAFNAMLLDFLERKAPRHAIEYESGSDPRVLRDALGCFGTGITVVTTFDAQGHPVGLTANSFTSVSLDPPLILFCLAKTSANLATFTAAKGFAINVLHIGQQPTSNRFARRDGDRFEGAAWERHPNSGSPILTGSLANFDCSLHAVHEGGDHMIFVGEVKHARFEPHRNPLLYFRGKYRRLHFA